jgi:hypothetical protein
MYGWYEGPPPAGVAIHLFKDRTGNPAQGSTSWFDVKEDKGVSPCVSFGENPVTGSNVFYPSNTLFATGLGPSGKDYAIIRFTVPRKAHYSVRARFFSAQHDDDADVFLLINGAEVLNQVVEGSLDAADCNTDVDLKSGDKVDFAFGGNGNPALHAANVGLEATISISDTPETQPKPNEPPATTRSDPSSVANSLMSAADSGDCATLKALIAAGADVNFQNSDGWTPLHAAATKGHADCIQALVNAGANVSATDKSGWSALQAALRISSTASVKALILGGEYYKAGFVDRCISGFRSAQAAAPVKPKTDLLFDDFESGSYVNWTFSGNCWTVDPMSGRPLGNGDTFDTIYGNKGSHFLGTTFSSSVQRSGGRAVSKDFTIAYPLISFRMRASELPVQTCLNLIVDGEVVRSATGLGDGDTHQYYWNVTSLVGKTAHFEVVESPASGQSGYIDVDDIRFVPASWSLRPHFERLGVKPLVQGNGDCVIFAVLQALQYCCACAGLRADLSPQWMEMGALRVGWDGRGSVAPDKLIKGIRHFGVCTSDLMPYEDKQRPFSLNQFKPASEAALADAATRTNARYIVLQWDHPGMDGTILNEMCEAIAAGHPVAFCLTWPDVSPMFGCTHTVDTMSSCSGGGHALLAVGYELGSGWEGGGRVQFINSWGQGWGDEGYGWVTFAYLRRTGGWAFVMQLTPKA